MTSKVIFPILILAVVYTSCNSDYKITNALNSITIEHLKKNISILSCDDFLGRAPTTLGEKKTINYLAEQFKELGLIPANGESFFQEVPLIKITPNNDMTLKFIGKSGSENLKFLDEFVGFTPQPKELINVENSDVVFVGYGVVAPEYNWDDYKGIDVKGKTVIALVNDPGFKTKDTTLFSGKAMTYYGRWTYKFEEARRQGAKAAIIIHETEAAAYPWTTVKNTWTGRSFHLENNEYTGSDLQFTAWITTDAAKKIFTSAGLDFNELSANANKRGFKAINLNLECFCHLTNKIDHIKSNNVAAVIPGASRANEYIIYTAHWDHFGVKPSLRPDSILNGAQDNACGVATLLEVAKAFKNLQKKQNRSILFLAVTGEEFGLLGSEYYASNPIFPLKNTVGVINLEGLNIFGKTKDMAIIGSGYSQMDDYAATVLKRQGRVVSSESKPEKGSYFRSDHFSFSKKGVPSLYLGQGVDNIEHGKDWGIQMNEKWTLENYHMPSDNYEPDKWDFSGMVDDVKAYFEIGYNLSMTDKFPDWKIQGPFKTLRDKMMKQESESD